MRSLGLLLFSLQLSRLTELQLHQTTSPTDILVSTYPVLIRFCSLTTTAGLDGRKHKIKVLGNPTTTHRFNASNSLFYKHRPYLKI